jgi:ketosteroid isomerase-like protein
MAEQDLQNIRGAYERFNAGDPQPALDMMAADVEWIEPGGGNSAKGTFTSPQSVAEGVFALIPANFDEYHIQLDDLQDKDDTVIATGRFTGKAKSGADLDSSFEHVFELEDGKIKRFENKVDQEAWTAGWS